MALDFDGVNDYVDFSDIATIDGTAAFTIMGWVMVDTLKLNTFFWGKTNGDRTFGFGTRNATDNTAAEVIISSAGSVSQSQTATGVIATGVWAHWAFVYAGGGATADDKVKIFKNGVNLGPLTHTATPVTTLPTGTGVLAAAWNQRDNIFLDCKLDNMKVWLASLTAAQVRQEVYDFRPRYETGLLIWAPYDNATTVADLSGNATLLPGTVTEATLTGRAAPIQYPLAKMARRTSRRRLVAGPFGRGQRRAPYISRISKKTY